VKGSINVGGGGRMDIDAGRVVSRKKEQIRESGNKERSNRRRKGSRVDRWQRCAEEL
jgi:hypothetical protein